MESIYDNQDDRLEIGNSGFVTVRDGWMYDPSNRHSMDPEGRVFDEDMELIFDPHDEEGFLTYEEDDYEWYHYEE